MSTAGLWIPDSARSEPAGDGKVWLCSAPGCDHRDEDGRPIPFATRSAFHAHSKACIERAQETIQARYTEGKDHAFTAPLDPERHNWFRKHAATPAGKKTRPDFPAKQ